MSTTVNAAAAPHPLSIGDALLALKAWTDWPAKQQADATAALNKIVRQDGRPAGTIPFTPAVVRTTILTRKPAVLGVTSGSKYTIASRIRHVMKRLDLIDAEDTPCSAPWETQLAQLDPHARATLTALARFCSARQIAPEALNAAVLTDLRHHLETRTLTPKPGKLVGAARGAWNRYCRTVPGWPGQCLPTLRPKPPTLPPTYHADRARFGARMGKPSKNPDRFTPPGKRAAETIPLTTCPKPLRDSSIALREAHCDWAAQTLIASGFPAEQITSLAVIVEPDNLGAIMRQLNEQTGGKPTARSMHIWEVLMIIVRYYVETPDEIVTWLQGFGEEVTLNYYGMTEKNERCVAAALVEDRDRKLLALPGVLMKAARAELPGNPRHAAGLAWRAVLLEILLTIPLRLGDIQRLRFDQHLYREDPRGGPVTTIRIPPDQTKNDREVNAPVAPPLAAMLATWTSTFRPLIADPVCGFLFPGQGTGDKPLSPQSMRDAVKQVTGQYVGVTLSPHQFRHLAAERFLRDNPGQYEELRRLLNHATVETTIRAYARKEQGAALQRYDDIITEQRSRLRSKRKPATKPQRGRRDA